VLDAQVSRYGLPGSPAELHRMFVEVDVAGRLRKAPDGTVVLGFGKHARRPLAEVARADPAYLAWVLANVPLLDDARQIIGRAAAGRRNPASD
jgi:hypothetical protein